MGVGGGEVGLRAGEGILEAVGFAALGGKAIREIGDLGVEVAGGDAVVLGLALVGGEGGKVEPGHEQREADEPDEIDEIEGDVHGYSPFFVFMS